MATYRYDKAVYELGQLDDEVRAAGLPGYLGANGGEGVVEVLFEAELSAPDESTLNGVVLAHVPAAPRQLRSVNAVYLDLQALTAVQKNNVWSYLIAPVGGVPRWRHANDEALWNAANVGEAAPTGATLLQERSKALAATFWAREFVTDFVHPPWDPSIFVPGDEPVA